MRLSVVDGRVLHVYERGHRVSGSGNVIEAGWPVLMIQVLVLTYLNL